MAILLPALLITFWLGAQAALYYHARNVALAAATEGARAAAVEGGRTSDGVAAAASFVADAGGDRVVEGLDVGGDRTADRVVITVRGSSVTLVPGWSPTFEVQAVARTERLTAAAP
ncbi:TadE/TadG family type IV pilus assembly protein [Xylanimonas allomyrinae]|nr:TadE/TadG family type IV pilus assembly protein [Xylanimonas allomyrinae]